jgi:hypothetical protein
MQQEVSGRIYLRNKAVAVAGQPLWGGQEKSLCIYTVQEADHKALINLLAQHFLCRGWLLVAGFIFIPGALLKPLASCSFHLCAWTLGVR